MKNIFAVAIASVAALVGFSGAANAAPNMYQGILSLHFFGNDATTGVTPPFDAYVFTAVPLGANCNPAVVGGMTCSPTATLQVGAPLTGSGTTSGGAGSPASIMFPSGQLGRITSGSLSPPYPSALYVKTYANLANAAGSFQAGGGPGSVIYSFGGPSSGVRITPGKNQFGGAMRLLKGGASGGWGTKAMFPYGSKIWVSSFPSWGVTIVGATSFSGYPALGIATGSGYYVTTPSVMFPYSGSVQGWPWTTGSVRVNAYRDWPSYFPESLARAGYDNRTPNGGGTIQLVTPHMAHWARVQYGAIAVLRLKFAPEPTGLPLLVAGMVLLGALYRRRGHSRSPSCESG
jgi:hypothetical protein